MEDNNSKGLNMSGAMIHVAAFIVDKRMLFFLIFIIAIIFSAFSSKWVEVENDVTTYLSEDTETKRGINIMDEEFITYGSADVMIANITFDDAKKLKKTLEEKDTIQSITFADRKDKEEDFVEHYNNGSALFSVTFDYDEDDERALKALEDVEEDLADYDIYVSTTMGDQDAIVLEQEMKKIKVVVAIIVLCVLLFTCESFGEIPVLLITLVSAMMLDGGTSFLFGKISFISNSVSSILQLAMSIDYAIILCNHYKEERGEYDVRDATVVALAKSIPEVCSSSLTTISGLFALVFMQFGIGRDLGTILIKAILLSLFTVFTLMPGLLVVFSGIMEKTEHKSFVPKIDWVGENAYRTYKVVPIVFLGIVVVAGVLSQRCPYVYGYSLLETPVLNQFQIADNMIHDNFGENNMVAVLLPGSDFEAEANYIKELEEREEVDKVVGLANTEAKDGYVLTDRLTPRELSEILKIDFGVCEILYQAYAADNDDYGRIITGVQNYRIPLMDMLHFAAEKVREGYVELDDSTADDLFDMDDQINDARDQLEGKNYDRILVDLDLPEESEETYAFLDYMHEIGERYYGKENKIVTAGNSMSDKELMEQFATDNIIVSVVSLLFVLVVLLFTFQSVGLPLLQILVIEGSIFINFAIPAITHSYIYFMSYLIVSSIQMGANIDYAIVVSSRYIEVRKKKDKREAIKEALNFGIHTIAASGSMMVFAGFSIGMMSSAPAVTGLGMSLGRGSTISIILVLFVLPQILLIGDRIIEITTFEMYHPIKTREESGDIQVNGVIRGTVNGTIAAKVNGVIKGDVNVSLVSGSMERILEEEQKDEQKALPKENAKAPSLEDKGGKEK